MRLRIYSNVMQEIESVMTRARYEANIASIVGETFEAVTYHEIDYSDGRYHFFDDPRFDSLDFGLEIKLGSGKQVSLTWGTEFWQYGVSLKDGAISAPRCLDVSSSPRWMGVIGRVLRSIDVSWNWVVHSGNMNTRICYPQDILLDFGGEMRRVVSALEIRENDWVMGMMDNIVVFDDLEIARKFKCLEEAE